MISGQDQDRTPETDHHRAQGKRGQDNGDSAAAGKCREGAGYSGWRGRSVPDQLSPEVNAGEEREGKIQDGAVDPDHSSDIEGRQPVGK